ncbi:MAG: hypothetical protein OSA83_07985 [Pseudomonadales bacterium]|nr:hypothetical protein [Pseudomonadales bacterium]
MSMTHPFDTDTTYELLDDGNVRLSCGDKAGIFTGEGIYVSGDIRFADPQVCNWVNNVPNPDTQLSVSRIVGRDDAGNKMTTHLG